MSEWPDYPSWYAWADTQPYRGLMPINAPPEGSDPLRARLDEFARELMAEAAERLQSQLPSFTWLMVPDNGPPPDDGNCTTTIGGIRCTRPRSWHIWAGCTQEHMVDGFMCVGHLETIESGAGTQWCAACRVYNEYQLTRPEPERQPLVSDEWKILRKVAA